MKKLLLFLALLFITPGAGATHRSALFLGSAALPFSNTKVLLNASTKYVNFGNSYDTADGTVPFSVSMWIYPTSGGSGNPYQGLFCKQRTSGAFQGFMLMYGYTSVGGNIFIQYATATGFSHRIETRTTASFAINNWYHVLVVYDGSKTAAGMKVYVNSTTPEAMTVGQDTMDSGSTSSTQPLYIGYDQPNNVYFPGGINQVAYFSNYALNSTDITNIMTPHPVDLTGFANLSSLWLFNQNDNATTITDRKGAINGSGVNLVSGDFVTTGPTPP